MNKEENRRAMTRQEVYEQTKRTATILNKDGKLSISRLQRNAQCSFATAKAITQKIKSNPCGNT